MANHAPSPGEPDTDMDPYETLGIEEDADDATIRSAYKKLALKHHPDKVLPSDRESAHKLFQSIAFAYAVLSDPKRRRRYDTTGSTAESALDDENFDWAEFFKSQYQKINSERIRDFEKEYKGGAEEKRDLLAAYTKFEGKMDKVYQNVMLSNPLDDEERFQETIREAIEAGEVEGYDAFLQESAASQKRRIDRAKREAQEAEEHTEDLGLGESTNGEKKAARRKGKKFGGDVEVEGEVSSDEDEDEGDEEGEEDFVEEDDAGEWEEEENDAEEEDEGEDDEEEVCRRPRRDRTKTDKEPPRSKAKDTASSAPKSEASSRKSKPTPGGGLGDLAAMIAQRQQSRANNTFLDDLEAKYAPKSGKGKKRATMDEPPEEAFAATAARKGSKRVNA